jgi:hypothetical protein
VQNIARPPLNRTLLPVVAEVQPRTHRGFVWCLRRRTENVTRPPLNRALLLVVAEVQPRCHRGFLKLPVVRVQNVVRPPLRGCSQPVVEELTPRGHRGVVVRTRPPVPGRIGGNPLPSPPLVVHPVLVRSGRGLVWQGHSWLITPRVATRPGQVVLWPGPGLPSLVERTGKGARQRIKPPPPPPPVPLPPDRTYRLRAAVTTTWQLRADAATTPTIRAAPRTTFYRRASDAMSVPSNFSFFQGEDVLLKFQLTPPADMTGWSLTCSIKDKLGGTLQFNPAVTIIDAGRGFFQASLPRASTSALAPGDYVWDVRRTDPGANTVLAHGECTCKQPVTP